MPKGNPSKQTIASAKYQKKAGYITKGFKIKRETAEVFEAACEKAGVSQAAKITELMLKFAESVEPRECQTIKAAYPAILTQTDSNVLVEVPDFSVLTEGKNIQDAIGMASFTVPDRKFKG